jgi:hypothetical protein
MFARVRVRSVLAAMTGALAMVACREVASPDAAKPLNAVRHLSPKEGGGTLDDLFEAVDREVPGFGGIYLDENENPVIALVSGSPHAAAEAAVRRHMGRIPGRADRAITYVNVA